MEYIVKHDKHSTWLEFDISDVNLNIKITANVAKLLRFPIKNYPKLKGSKVSHMLGTVNMFFSTLTPEVKTKIAETIITMHAITLLDNVDLVNNLARIGDKEKEISKLYVKLDRDINLVALLKEFVIINIPLGEFSNTGRRPQDSDALTFFEEEFLEVTVIAMITKLLIPIYSVFMFNIENLIDTHIKERHAANLPEGVINKHFSKVYDKLKFYIEHNTRIKFKESPSAIFNGKTTLNMFETNIENLLVRHLPNVDLHRPNGNIMKYIVSSARSCITSNESMIRKNKYNEKIISDNLEESNDSAFEQDTLRSTSTLADAKMIVSTSVPNVVRNMLLSCDLDLELYQKGVEYYNRHPITPSKFNIFMNSMVFGDRLEGSKSILLLDHSEYTQLTAAVQLYVLKLGYLDLAIMMTAVTSSAIVVLHSTNKAKIKVTYKSTIPYQDCKMYYELKLTRAKMLWEKELTILVDNLCDLNYNLNLPIWLCKQYNIDFTNKQVDIPVNIITSLCHFLLEAILQ